MIRLFELSSYVVVIFYGVQCGFNGLFEFDSHVTAIMRCFIVRLHPIHFQHNLHLLKTPKCFHCANSSNFCTIEQQES